MCVTIYIPLRKSYLLLYTIVIYNHKVAPYTRVGRSTVTVRHLSAVERAAVMQEAKTTKIRIDYALQPAVLGNRELAGRHSQRCSIGSVCVLVRHIDHHYAVLDDMRLNYSV